MKPFLVFILLLQIHVLFASDTLFCERKNGEVIAVATADIEHIKIGDTYFAGEVMDVTDSSLIYKVVYQDITIAGERTLFERKKIRNEKFSKDTTIEIKFFYIHALFLDRNESDFVSGLRTAGVYLTHFAVFLASGLITRSSDSGLVSFAIPLGLTLTSFAYTGKLYGASKFINTTNKTLSRKRPGEDDLENPLLIDEF